MAAIVSTDEWRDLLNSTGNKLDYESIADALQTLWDEKLATGRSVKCYDFDDWWQDGEESQWPASAESPWDWPGNGWNDKDWNDSQTGQEGNTPWTGAGNLNAVHQQVAAVQEESDPELKEAQQSERAAEMFAQEATKSSISPKFESNVWKECGNVFA